MAWTSAEMAEHGLRQIGAFSPYDLAPDPAYFDIALSRLDALVAYVVATEGLWFFEEVEQELTLTASTTSYDFNSLLDTDLQYISSVARTLNGEDRTPVTMIRVNKYDELKADDPDSAIPDFVYIERKDSGLLYPWGVPTVSGYKFHIRGRTFTGNLEQDGGANQTGFTEAWNLCLMNLLAHDLGSGAITTLPKGDRDDFRNTGREMQRTLRTYNSRENVQKPRRTAYRDI